MKSFKQLINDIDLQCFTVDWCSDDGLDFDSLSEKYCASVTNLKKYAGMHKLKRSPVFIKNKREKTNILRFGFASASCNDTIKEKIKKTTLQHYGVENPTQSKEIQNKIKQTNLKKYGSECVFQNSEIKDKIKQTNLKKYGSKCVFQNQEIQNKIKQTNIDKFGVDNPFKATEIQDKIKQTNFEKYGVKYSILNESVKNKIKNTNKEKYGSENPFGSNIIQNKIKQTNLNKYGVENPTQSKEIQNKIKQTNIERYGVSCSLLNSDIHEKAKKTFNNKYGVDNYGLLAQQYTNGPKSIPNQLFEKLLRSKNISFEREFRIGNYSFDFKVGGILIEIDPSYTHNVNYGFHGAKPISKDYHVKKSLAAENAGYFCIHVWDWDDLDIVLNLLASKKKIYARNTQVKEITSKDANLFLSKFHLQKRCRGQTICLGLFYKTKLVEIMSFGKPRYNRKYEYELLRLCTDSTTVTIGGSQKLFQYFIKKYNPKSIITYCDCSKFSGKIYEKLGFTLQSTNITPSCHWYNMKTKRHITDNLLRQKGYDKLFHTSYGKGSSNEKLMLQNGFVRIYDCGQKTWVFTK